MLTRESPRNGVILFVKAGDVEGRMHNAFADDAWGRCQSQLSTASTRCLGGQSVRFKAACQIVCGPFAATIECWQANRVWMRRMIVHP